jgi:tetratricopeptide (TPR) repeat protein
MSSAFRHALRDKHTFLIRCKGVPDVPFDLKTDRYLEYDKDKPGDALESLVRGLQDTMNSCLRDSPVFQLLPALDPPKREKLLLVPSDYGEEVERALKEKRAGDLGLLAAEARGFQWEVAALRIVGRAQFKLKALEGARTSWERVREIESNDVEADIIPGTVYQRLNRLTLSDEALDRAIKAKDINSEQRAEVHALRGRNGKTHWLEAWLEKPGPQQAVEALASIFLTQAKDQYAFGFRENLNHFYSGLNALGLLTIITELAARHPEVWELQFDSADDADCALGRRGRRWPGWHKGYDHAGR